MHRGSRTQLIGAVANKAHRSFVAYKGCITARLSVKLYTTLSLAGQRERSL
jgi:hypothetical protein